LIFNEYIEQIQKLIGENMYDDAQGVVEEFGGFTDILSNADTHDLHVSQIDVNAFPTINLYIQIIDPRTGEVADVADVRKFSLMEDSAGRFIAKELTRVLQLEQAERLSICLTADISGSMEWYMDDVKYVMSSFLSNIQFNVGDSAALVTFDDNITIDVDYSSDFTRINNAINAMTSGNMTALYDALYVSVGNAVRQSGAKCVVAFTDGQDNSSLKSPGEVISLALRFKIPIFIIGIGGDVDSYTLTHVASSTGGFYRSVDSGVSMEQIYNEIYRQQKKMYLLEYTTDSSSPATAGRDLFIAYNDGQVKTRCETSYTPSVLMEKPRDYEALVGRSDVPNDQAEKERLRIRDIWVADRDAVSKGTFYSKTVARGITAYCDQRGQVRLLEVNKGIDGFNYSRTYLYENGSLVFAYYESGDAHRLYFKNEKLFRWRYTPDAKAINNAVNLDNRGDSPEFRYWEDFTLNEGRKLYAQAQ